MFAGPCDIRLSVSKLTQLPKDVTIQQSLKNYIIEVYIYRETIP